MHTYEIAVLFHPDLEIDLSKPQAKVEKIITDNGGKITKTDSWGKKKLAYQIAKQDHAVYVFYTVELPAEGVRKVEATLNITDEVIRSINTRARIALCGQVSQRTGDQPEMGPRWLDQLILKQARIEGFQFTQFSARFEDALRQIALWLRQGKIRYQEDVVEGIENAPKAFIGMLTGESVGKRLVKVAA